MASATQHRFVPHLNTQEQRVINLLSTEEKDGKTHVARLIEEYWNNIGLNVRRITYDEFSKARQPICTGKHLEKNYVPIWKR